MEAVEAPAAIGEWRPDRLDAPSVEADIEMLGEALHAAVHGGARASLTPALEAATIMYEELAPAERRS